MRFIGWPKPLNVASETDDGSILSPPACSKGSKTLLGVDYVRSLTGNGIAASTPRVSVTPSTHLHDGQRVRVQVSGLDIEAKYFVSECATAAPANDNGCGQQLAAQAFSLTDVSGQGYMTFQVHPEAFGARYSAGQQSCGARCVIVVTLGDGGLFTYVPAAFAQAPTGH